MRSVEIENIYKSFFALWKNKFEGEYARCPIREAMKKTNAFYSKENNPDKMAAEVVCGVAEESEKLLDKWTEEGGKEAFLKRLEQSCNERFLKPTLMQLLRRAAKEEIFISQKGLDKVFQNQFKAWKESAANYVHNMSLPKAVESANAVFLSGESHLKGKKREVAEIVKAESGKLLESWQDKPASQNAFFDQLEKLSYDRFMNQNPSLPARLRKTIFKTPAP